MLELDGLKAGPILHPCTTTDNNDHGAEETGMGFLPRGARLLQKEFLGKFAQPEETAMNVLALVREQEEGEEG